jgi:hypothetical protein
LLENKITIVGTIKANKKGLPNEVKSLDGREPNSYKVFWEKEKGKLTLHSYAVETKSKGKKTYLP